MQPSCKTSHWLFSAFLKVGSLRREEPRKYYIKPAKFLLACRLEPDNIRLHWQQANLYCEIKETKKALETYEHVVTVSSHVVMGRGHVVMGRSHVVNSE